MNLTITVGGLLLTLGVIFGLLITSFGVVMTFAAGMSDAYDAGNKAGKQGCFTFLAGLALAVGSLLGLIL